MTCACFYIYIGDTLLWKIYMMLSGYASYIQLGALVYAWPMLIALSLQEQNSCERISIGREPNVGEVRCMQNQDIHIYMHL